MFPEELQVWINHFEYHAQHPRCIPDGVGDVLEPEERRLLAGSIAAFQRREQPDGAALMSAAGSFARARQLGGLLRITELLVREQQRHAALLDEFMTDHGIAPAAQGWADRVRRRVRRLAGFELCLYALITAGLIGKVCYRALESATGCERLKVLCRMLVCDELAHIGFESELIIALRATRPHALRTLMRLAHRACLAATACLLWGTHRAVLRRAGYSASGFLRACLAQYSFYLEPASVALPFKRAAAVRSPGAPSRRSG
jgi:hypothetical protein